MSEPEIMALRSELMSLAGRLSAACKAVEAELQRLE